MDRLEILKQAEQIVSVDRQEQYGDIEDNFRTIANFWSEYLLAAYGEAVTIVAEDVAAMMALLKIARIAGSTRETPYPDSWVDLAGYAACGGELEAKGAEE